MLLPAIYTVLISVTAAIKTVNEANITHYNPEKLLTKIFNLNVTLATRQRGYGLVFEDQVNPQTDDRGQYGQITFEDQRLKFEDPQNDKRPLRFDDQNDEKPDRPLRFEDQVREQVTFQDDNKIDHSNKRRKRRRRKPKNGLQNHHGVPHYQGVPGDSPGFPGPEFGTIPYPTNPGLGSPANPGLSGNRPFRRRRRPRPSLASDALTAVTGALTSIALYDDYQCVPRLLCEAAGGGSLGSNGVLDSIAGIQPLLTILSAYNGISSSPLFVFGRAVFLGMTSRGNTGTCRYAYPQCPTDPEQLIHYLNNHNGGFFRFFNAPLPNQNLEQFYNQLGQNGNLEQFSNSLGQNGQFLGQNGHFGQDVSHYGQPIFGQNQQYFHHDQGGYGLYGNQLLSQQEYGSQTNQIGQRPGVYGQNYGSNYDYDTYGSQNVRFKDANTKIEKRIQNKPVQNDFNDSIDSIEEENDNSDSKWLFPEETNSYGNQNAYEDNERDGEPLKFPEESQKYENNRDSKRKGKSILFPENQFNQNAYSNKKYVTSGNQNVNYNVQTDRPYYQHNYYNKYQNVVSANIYKQTTTSPFNENDYYYNHKHNFYVKKDQNVVNVNNDNYKYQNNVYNNNNQDYYKDQNKVNNHGNNNYYYNGYKPVSNVNYDNYDSSKIKDDGTQTVYIVRGHGDPNRPEIIKVRPGQTVT